MDFVEEWIRYSEDKRTSGGWYVTEQGIVGRAGEPDKMVFSTIEEAIAEYVVRELDYWAAV
jgi:hypothetical protein